MSMGRNHRRHLGVFAWIQGDPDDSRYSMPR